MRDESALTMGIASPLPPYSPTLEEAERHAAPKRFVYFSRFSTHQGHATVSSSAGNAAGTIKQYKRGWHCKECRKAAASLASANRTRKAMRDKWMRLAVNARRKYKPVYGEQPIWMATQVNKHLRFSERVKRNWITRNLDEIELRASKE